ncbi:MAG: hypothetical protein HQL53_04370 [Magnetococcales bacterium]|nr:hypothetical protein [Magnetococcales bacterium]
MTKQQPQVDKPWTIRSVPDDVRQLAKQAARQEGMTLSNWVTRELRQASLSTIEKRTPRSLKESRGDADVLERLDQRMERLEWIMLPLSAMLQRHSVMNGDEALPGLSRSRHARHLD